MVKVVRVRAKDVYILQLEKRVNEMDGVIRCQQVTLSRMREDIDMLGTWQNTAQKVIHSIGQGAVSFEKKAKNTIKDVWFHLWLSMNASALSTAHRIKDSGLAKASGDKFFKLIEALA